GRPRSFFGRRFARVRLARAPDAWPCPPAATASLVSRLVWSCFLPCGRRVGDLPHWAHDGGAAGACPRSATSRPKRLAFFFTPSTARACCAASYSAADTLAGSAPDFSAWYTKRASLCAVAVTAF